MEAILANLLRQHKSHEAWWYFIKKKQEASPKDALKQPEAKKDKPVKYFLSKLLQISKNELWEVLIDCHLAKSAEKRGGILDQTKIGHFLASHNSLGYCCWCVHQY